MDPELVTEEHYHDGSVGALALNQSVGKSYASALVGLACDQGCQRLAVSAAAEPEEEQR